MFPKAKNIEAAFQQVRMFSLVVIVCTVGMAGFVTYKSYHLAENLQSHIYVLAGGKAIEAFASDRNENLPVEARDHVRTFHQWFFTLAPDEKAIQATITKALYLADGSAKSLYESLKENNYYTGIITGNVSQEITVDSVSVDLASAPYSFRCWATQRITRPSAVTTRSLITEGSLRPVSRSDNNPHGFLIEKWRILDNRDIKTEKR
ncbi:conjugative transposon protein TraK [Flavisolibacter nicotianae]|uniref:conjugative transposon protein TraK n=1 Tax=Flavisolibacter nicotianae TaxID=2364882 RepID=UPI000EB373EA|nr:conjugative transposon protein TraK [Flavisolibacter nicotianae]